MFIKNGTYISFPLSSGLLSEPEENVDSRTGLAL